MAGPIYQNLTIGPIRLHFLSLAVPAAIGMLFNTLYNIVDIFFAGLLSTSAQAGLALGYQAFYIALSVGVGLGAAMGALIGNALGSGDRRKVRRLSAQGLSFAVIASLALMAVGAWYGPAIIDLVSAPGAYQTEGKRYYLYLSIALPGFLCAQACNGILQAHGDGRSMQHALIVAFFANIALNPLFIFGVPGMWSGFGFDGLALSTVASQLGVMIYMIRKVLRLPTLARLKVRNFKPKPDKFQEITAQALPISLSMLIMFLSGFVTQFALKGFGEHAVAAHGIAIRLEQILLLPVLGMTTALLPIAAQSFGARKFERTRSALYLCWKIGLMLTIAAAPVLWFGGAYFMSYFTDDPEVMRVGVSYLRVEALLQPVFMMLFSINSFLQALKRPLWTVWISLYRQGFGVAFFVWIFVSILDFTEVGVWYGTAMAVLTGLLFSLTVLSAVMRKELQEA